MPGHIGIVRDGFLRNPFQVSVA